MSISWMGGFGGAGTTTTSGVSSCSGSGARGFSVAFIGVECGMTAGRELASTAGWSAKADVSASGEASLLERPAV